MKIIDDLITELTNNNISLTNILIKTKVLAHKLKNDELKTWIDSEQNGYSSNNVPEYRILACQSTGTISNGIQNFDNHFALDSRSLFFKNIHGSRASD